MDIGRDFGGSQLPLVSSLSAVGLLGAVADLSKKKVTDVEFGDEMVVSAGAKKGCFAPGILHSGSSISDLSVGATLQTRWEQ